MTTQDDVMNARIAAAYMDGHDEQLEVIAKKDAEITELRAQVAELERMLTSDNPGVDFTQAPKWASSWAVDGSGEAFWYGAEFCADDKVWVPAFEAAPDFDYIGYPRDSLTMRFASAKEVSVERCADCKFFKHGQCRKRAPELDPMGAYKALSPTVPDDYWCGEFRLKAMCKEQS